MILGHIDNEGRWLPNPYLGVTPYTQKYVMVEKGWICNGCDHTPGTCICKENTNEIR